jgi:hypothetical protein
LTDLDITFSFYFDFDIDLRSPPFDWSFPGVIVILWMFFGVSAD